MELSVLDPVFRLPVNPEELSVEVLSLASRDTSANKLSISHDPLSLKLENNRFTQAQALSQYLQEKNREGYTTQLITKENSYAPIDADIDLIRAVLTSHDVMPAIQQVILAFRPMSNRLEEAYSESLWKCEKADILEITYVLKFPEPRATDGQKTEWSIRKLGIYQKYNISNGQNTWILIYPNRESTIKTTLAHSLDPQRDKLPILDHPLAMHRILIMSRIDNWRPYISQFEREVWELGDLSATIDIEDVLPFRDTYMDLSTLHYLESRLAPLRSIFAANKRLLDALDLINNRLENQGHITRQNAWEMRESLINLKSRILANDENVDFVLSKLSRITELLSGTINLKSQHASEDMSNRVYDLTRSAFEDSTSMRVTTFTTLLFLPSTFVAGIFGMGFFSVGGDSHVAWNMSPLVWIFFAIAIPLTMITLLYWRWSMMRAIKRTADKAGLRWHV